MPGGGGRRTPTAVSAVVPPSVATTRRVRTVRISAGVPQSVSVACGAGERLIAAYDARGFYTAKPPTAQLIKDVVVKRKVAGGRVVASVLAGAGVLGVDAVVQVSAVCAGGR
jgi:hypothetical protein